MGLKGDKIDPSLGIPAGCQIKYVFLALGSDGLPYDLNPGSSIPFQVEIRPLGAPDGIGAQRLKKEAFKGCQGSMATYLHEDTGEYIIKASSKGGERLLESTIVVKPGCIVAACSEAAQILILALGPDPDPDPGIRGVGRES